MGPSKRHAGGYIVKSIKIWQKLTEDEFLASKTVKEYARVAIDITSLRDLDKIDAVADPSVVDLWFTDYDLKDTARLILISNKKHRFNYLMKEKA